MGEGAVQGIDIGQFVSDSDSINKPFVRTHKKIGRNETCPCGSGKKFKNCCFGNGIYD